MTRLLTRSRAILIFLGIGMALMLILACTSEGPAVAGTDQPNTGASGQPDVAAGLPPRERALLELAEQQRIASGAIAGLGGPVATRNGILVSGRGKATAPPDLAVLNLGVAAFATTVSQARETAEGAMGRVAEVLKSRNVAQRDIQTRFFNINPRYTTREITRCPEVQEPDLGRTESVLPTEPVAPVLSSRGIPEGPVVELARPPIKEECFKDRERVIIGYEVNNQLTVRIRDLDAVGEVIDAVTEAGGDLIRFQGINFTIEDSDALQVQARTAALQDVMAKANQVATITGVQLGKLIHVSETGGSPRIEPLAMARSAFAIAEAAPTPIMAGELDVIVTVQALYAIE